MWKVEVCVGTVNSKAEIDLWLDYVKGLQWYSIIEDKRTGSLKVLI